MIQINSISRLRIYGLIEFLGLFYVILQVEYYLSTGYLSELSQPELPEVFNMVKRLNQQSSFYTCSGRFPFFWN